MPIRVSDSEALLTVFYQKQYSVKKLNFESILNCGRYGFITIYQGTVEIVNFTWPTFFLGLVEGHTDCVC